jgi:cytoskeletal protein CcmA (bactofilin family)
MMWKRQDEPARNPGGAATPANPFNEPAMGAAIPQFPDRKIEMEHATPKASIAHIGKSVQIKGELTGSEDLLIDGQVTGSIELPDYQLTVGASGKVQANVNAKKVVISGTVKGNIHAVDNVTISKSGSLVGDVVVAGIVIEDGAYFKGSIDIQRPQENAAKPTPPKKIETAPPPSGEASKLAAVAARA